jgi:hypothetical protein
MPLGGHGADPIKEHVPAELERPSGRERAPEVTALRPKPERLAKLERSEGRFLSRRPGGHGRPDFPVPALPLGPVGAQQLHETTMQTWMDGNTLWELFAISPPFPT